MAKAPKAEPTLEELAHAQALRDVAVELRAIDDAIDYLESIRALKRANIRAELEARGLRSSETIARGMKAALSPFEIIVCTCHGLDPRACDNVVAGRAVAFETRVNGDYLSVTFDGRIPAKTVPRFDTDVAA